MRQRDLQVLRLQEIAPLLTRESVRDAVRSAFIDLWRGAVRCPPPGHMLFESPRGDCHIKSAQSDEATHFSVKIATGFYGNGQCGLPVNDGIIVLFDAATGRPAAVLQDEGWITSWRTAAAGSLLVETLAVPDATIGIVGTGHQAKLQAAWIHRLLGEPGIRVWGRSQTSASRLCEELDALGVGAAPVGSVAALAATCQVIVMCTASDTPLLSARHLSAGMCVISLGADGAEKSELAPDVFAAASWIITDDHLQCLAHGDFGRAVRSGVVPEDVDISVGEVMHHRRLLQRSANDIVVATLTGSGAQDLAVATLVLEERKIGGQAMTARMLETLD